MDADRKFVEEHWEDAGGDPFGDPPVYVAMGKKTLRFADFAAAKAYTEARLKQIAEVEEEIETLKSLSVPLAKIAPLLRSGRRAEAELQELRVGMKQV